MTDPELTRLIDSLIHESISETEHRQLQQRLKSDAEARAIFRERMDLEAALRTWASESPDKASPVRNADITPTAIGTRRFFWGSVLAVVAALIAIPLVWIAWNDSENNAQPFAKQPQPAPRSQELANQFVGRIREQPGTQWEKRPPSEKDRIAKGEYILARGVTEFRFDSGTDLILEAPCQLTVASWDSAQLLRGNVFVNVTELSSGFTLSTPEGDILDEGTEYAVALDADATEIHVFDGSVIWVPEANETKTEERIEAGEAKRFVNTAPARGHHIPFGQRQFVRRIEADLKEQAGDALLAYDGFENLAGQIRRNRSGFGWSLGWEPGTRRGNRGKLATIVDAPDDVVFGISRKGRRLLSLAAGDDIRREFESPLTMQSGETYFLSFLMERLPAQDNSRRSLQISLEPNRPRRGHRQQPIVSFGVTSEGFPFLRVGHSITETAAPINDHEVRLCVVKVIRSEQTVEARMRIYHDGEKPNAFETDVWTVTGTGPVTSTRANAIRLTVGSRAHWQVDELRIGQTWNSVTTDPESD